MSSITIDKIPDRVWAALKRSAEAHRRSIEVEAAEWLARAMPEPDARSAQELLDEIRKTREELAAAGIWLTRDEIERALKEGRE